MQWHKAFTLRSSPQESFIKRIKIDGKEICVVKNSDRIFAFQNKCPHAAGELCNGWLSEGMIVCPVHHRKFNMETGQGQDNQGDYIDIYQTERRGNEIYIKLPVSLNPFRWIMKLFD